MKIDMLVSHDPGISEEEWATIIANSSEHFINENKLTSFLFQWQETIK